ncbi:MAG: DUF4416 family protein [bacterium]|nr:DUF4416 family protein [bacterium]
MNRALLFCGLLYKDRDYRNRAISELVDSYGEIKSYSKTLNFSSFSNYYEAELGDEIIREWILFSEMIDLDHLYEKKVNSCSIENHFRRDGMRTVNIDPGVITLNNLQLLTTKNFAHRIYIGEGIYCEVTLLFTRTGIKHLDWTYPDYKTIEAGDFFKEARRSLKNT